MVTVDERSIMKVWNIKMNSEVGMLSDQEGQKLSKVVWWRNGKKVVTCVEGNNELWVYDIEAIKLESRIQVQDVSDVSAMCFINDREFCCVGGMPKKQLTFLGNRFPKHRYLKFVCMESLKEVRSFKLKCEEYEDTLGHMVYTNK